MNKHEKINYVEFPARNLTATKAFFTQVFGWDFTDYGPDYTSFANAGLDGGFYLADKSSRREEGGALIAFFSEDLQATQAKVIEAKGEICTPIFSFPGGRRFHFVEPSGNEFAVWSDREVSS